MFNLIHFEQQVIDYKPDYSDCPNVLEGAKVVHALCPIDPRTRNPSSLTDALRRAVKDPSLQSLVSQVVQDLPAIRSDSRLTDDDRLDLVIDRFSVGTPAENALMAERLAQISSVLFPDKSVPDLAPEPAPESAPEPAPAVD